MARRLHAPHFYILLERAVPWLGRFVIVAWRESCRGQPQRVQHFCGWLANAPGERARLFQP